jgi:hypothetical protein
VPAEWQSPFGNTDESKIVEYRRMTRYAGPIPAVKSTGTKAGRQQIIRSDRTMNGVLLAVLIVLGAIFVLALIAGLVYFILFIVKNLSGTTGGWRQLAETYATTQTPAGESAVRQTIQIGAVTYKRCVTLTVADEGLYVSIWRKTALIPWPEFKGIGEATLFWQKVPLFTVGDPTVATMTLPVPIFQRIQAKLSTAAAQL